jgi:hypothetical protein
VGHTQAAGVQWPHVKDVDTLHLSENLETLKTGRLFDIGGNSTGLRAGREEIGLGVDFYEYNLLAMVIVRDSCRRLSLGHAKKV